MRQCIYTSNKRSLSEVSLVSDLLQKVLDVVPSPIYPDPNTLPTPVPLY